MKFYGKILFVVLFFVSIGSFVYGKSEICEKGSYVSSYLGFLIRQESMTNLDDDAGVKAVRLIFEAIENGKGHLTTKHGDIICFTVCGIGYSENKHLMIRYYSPSQGHEIAKLKTPQDYVAFLLEGGRPTSLFLYAEFMFNPNLKTFDFEVADIYSDPDFEESGGSAFDRIEVCDEIERRTLQLRKYKLKGKLALDKKGRWQKTGKIEEETIRTFYSFIIQQIHNHVTKP